jgi:hypothetical protein
MQVTQASASVRTRAALSRVPIYALVAAILLLGLLASSAFAPRDESPVPVDDIGLFLGP